LRFHPDKLLIFGAFPSDQVSTTDAQGIIHSIAFSQDESIAIPDFALYATYRHARILQMTYRFYADMADTSAISAYVDIYDIYL
jgi:uncharacterized protein YfdQ (DUF2303 family)